MAHDITTSHGYPNPRPAKGLTMAEEEARNVQETAALDAEVIRMWPTNSVQRIAQLLTIASGRVVTCRQVYAIARRIDKGR